MRFILMGQVENITKSLRREDFRQELLFADARPELQGKHLHLETPEDGCLYEGDILSPEESLKQFYDFIVIFADQGMVQIYRWLYANGVPFGRVLRYPQFFAHSLAGVVYDISLVQEINTVIEQKKIRTLLDADGYFMTGPGFTAPMGLLPVRLFGIVDQDRASYRIYQNLYEQSYGSLADIHGRSFDLLVVMRPMDVEACQAFLQATDGCARRVLFYAASADCEELRQADFSRWGQVEWREIPQGGLLLVDKYPEASIGIYVVTHKKISIPAEDGIYKVIQAGRGIHLELGYIGDHTGDNISEYNPYINECTALYWLWKHAPEKYLGMVHYRRFFIRPENADKLCLLDEVAVRGYLEAYDVVLVQEWVSDVMVSQQLEQDVGEEQCREILSVFERVMACRQPDYLPALRYVMTNKGFYRCNMFIMDKRYMDAYCTWLFSFLLDVVRESGVMEQGSHLPQRGIGFFAERMLTVWLMYQDLRIKELPILELK